MLYATLTFLTGVDIPCIIIRVNSVERQKCFNKIIQYTM